MPVFLSFTGPMLPLVRAKGEWESWREEEEWTVFVKRHAFLCCIMLLLKSTDHALHYNCCQADSLLY